MAKHTCVRAHAPSMMTCMFTMNSRDSPTFVCLGRCHLLQHLVLVRKVPQLRSHAGQGHAPAAQYILALPHANQLDSMLCSPA